MNDLRQPAIFDGHNDLLLKLYMAGGRDQAAKFGTGLDGHLDLTKARTGGFAGGFFAVYIPSPYNIVGNFREMRKASYDLPLPDPVPYDEAVKVAKSQAETLFELEKLGYLRVCRTVADIRACLADNVIAAIFHMEGAEAIDEDLQSLDIFYRAGLRSLGPVWSRPTIFGHGVPFRYPSTGDIGPGLTDAGKRLIRRCDELGVMVDLSHLNEAGFWDVAKISGKPLVATHSNAYALCPHARNLTDDQLAAIRDSDGMVGLNFAVAFLRSDGRMEDTSVTDMIRHIDYLMDKLGEDRVGLGSDFDGAMVPSQIGNVAGLPVLRASMALRGYSDELIAKICHGNWLRVLEKTWGAAKS